MKSIKNSARNSAANATATRYNKSVGQEWKTLEAAIELHSAGRPNAAKCLWNKFPEDFQRAVLQFVLDIEAASAETVDSCPRIVLESSYGEIHLSPEKLRALRNTAPFFV